MTKYLLALFLYPFTLINFYGQDSLKVEVKDSISKSVPSDLLFKKSKFREFSISPDGKYFAEVLENNIENDIVIVDIDAYKLYNQIPMGGQSIQNIYWISSKRLLYESMGEILAIDIDGTNSTLIVGKLADKMEKDFYSIYKSIRYNNVISLLPNNKNEILIETFNYEGYATIKRVNVYTGEKITVLDGKHYNINKWVTDAVGDVKMGIRFKDEQIYYLEKNQDSDKWEQFFVTIDGVKHPLIINATSYLNQDIVFLGFGFNPDIVYLTTNINSDKRRLVSFSLSENKIKDNLLEDINCDANDPNGEELTLIFDYNNFTLAGVKYDGIIPQYKWFSDEYKKKHEQLNVQFPGFVNEIIDSDYSNERLLIKQWSDNSAGNIGVYDSNDNSYSVMFHLNEELNKYKLSKTKILIAPTRDNYKLPCYLNLPLDYSETEKKPLVVIPHGGPWARDYWKLDDFSQYFASRGYATLRVNFRGSTGFGKKHVLAGVNSIDDVMINDIADAVNYVKDNYEIDSESIFIFGHSYGGYAVYMSLIKYPELYASGVALSAPSNIKNWMKLQKKEKKYFSYEFWNAALGSNESKYLSNISPINHIEEIKKPLLIFHGKRDGIIPVEQAEDMVAKLKEFNKDVKLEVLQNEGHSIYDSNSLGYILESANEFFLKFIKKN